MECLPKFTEDETDKCETPQDLLEADATLRFLKAYNSMMRRRVDGFEDVTVERLNNDYNRAKKVADDALNMKLPMGITLGIAGHVANLMDQHLDDVKGRDLERVLSEDEVRERLGEMLDFNKLMRMCESYYLNIEYDEALRNAGVLGENEKYSLPIPKITEREMRHLETTSEVNELFIDDARLTDAQTLSDFNYHGRPLPKKLKQFEEALPLDRESLKVVGERSKDLDDDSEIQKLFAEVRQSSKPESPKVRFLSYYKPKSDRHSFMHMRSSNRLADVTETDLNNGLEPIGIGTYLRLQLFLAINDKEAAKDFNTLVSSGHSDIDRGRASILLNNVLPSGLVYCIVDDTPGKGLKLIPVNPGGREFNQTYMEGFFTE